MTLRFQFLSSLFFGSLLVLSSCGSDEDDPLPDAPEACFTTTGELMASTPISFTSDCSVNAVSYAWDFGDSNTSTEENPVHSFASSGKFSVKLTVTSASGAQHAMTQSLDIGKIEKVVHFGDINADETWKAGVIHVVFSFVTINNATVTIEPGAVVRFTERANLEVGTDDGITTATLIAQGTADKPILFTADSDTPLAGYWENITFGSGDSGNSIIENCIIEYGGGYDTFGDAMIRINGSAVTVQNNTLRKSAGYAAYVASPGSFKSFTGNVVSECAQGSLMMDAETVPSIGLNNTLTDFVMVTGSYIRGATPTWKKLNVPYHMQGGTLYVGSEAGTSWSIEAGTTIKFPGRANVLIGGFATSKATLIAHGTSAEPITFTSVTSDPALTDRWGALQFGVGANALTSLKHCVVANCGLTGSTAEYSGIVIKDCSINIESTTILNPLDYAILLNSEGSFGTFVNNTIDNPGDDGIYIHANWAHTIGTGNTFNAARGILVQTDIITQSDATWLKQPVPYIIKGPGSSGLIISNETPEGAKLTLAPGVQILMGVYGDIVAGDGYGKGALIASGTEMERILISSERDPKENGDWGGIRFGSSTTTGILNYCTIEYGGYYYSDGMIHVGYTDTPVITNCIIRNSKSYGIVLSNASPTMSGNTFSGNAQADVY